MTVKSVLDLEDDLEVEILTIIDYHSCDGRVVKALDLKSNGSSRTGSIPARSETFCNTATRYLKQKRRNGKQITDLCKQNGPTNKNKKTQKDNLGRSCESTFGHEV